MTQCQVCHQRNAVVRLTEIVGNEVATLHLCSQCAAERGIETDLDTVQSPLGAFLAAMGSGTDSAPSASAPARTCPGCAATLDDFRASGRMGCAQCWTSFAPTLRDLVRRVHGSAHHTGALYSPPPAIGDVPDGRIPQRVVLREALRAAIAAEQFERAAELRDQLRVLDGE